MARTNDVMNFTINLRGGKQAKAELEGIVEGAKKADRARESAKRDSGGGGGRDAGGGGGAGTNLKDIVFGNLIAGGLQRSFSALSRTLTTAFDANLTRTERDVASIQAGLSAVPFVGDAAAGLFGNAFQVETGTAAGTAQRLNTAFGPAFAAFGAANPNLEGEALEKALRERFGKQIEAAQAFFKPQERAREIGSKLIADLDEGLSSNDLENVRDRSLERISKDLERLFGVTLDEIKAIFNGDAIVAKMDEIKDGFSQTIDDLGNDISEGFENLKGYFNIGSNG